MLAPTYGVIVYQEQVMQIAQVLAGYSLGGADLLRRAMGKKVARGNGEGTRQFEAGAAERGVDPRRATQIFDLMEKFAEARLQQVALGRVRGLVAYQTAWLKVHYPAEFMAAVLSSDMDNTDKVVGFLDEARALGLTVLPPDANASATCSARWTRAPSATASARSRGVGRGACEAIVEERGRSGDFATCSISAGAWTRPGSTATCSRR